MEGLTEQQVREIVQDEMNRNYRSGSTQIPPHIHDGSNSPVINLLNLTGFSAIPTTAKKYLNPNNGLSEYGYGYVGQLEPGSATHTPQYLANPAVVQIPIPVVVGNGVGTQGAFNGGYAPDGTMVLFTTGAPTLSLLYIRFNGQWYGISVNTVI